MCRNSGFCSERRFSRFSYYTLQVKKIWLFGDWPNRWGADTGTDLIVETHDGKVWPIQATAYGRDQLVTQPQV